MFDIIGTVAFAISGAVKGIKHNMDLFGVVMTGLTTGVGGGVIRDAMIGNTPAIAFRKPYSSLIAIAAALVVFLIEYFASARTRQNIRNHEKWMMFVTDTVGLGVFTVNGVKIAAENGVTDFTALVFIGAITGVGGGILRDILCGTVPSVFRKHVYASASAVGAVINVLAARICSSQTAMILSFAAIIIIRILAAVFEWNLPHVKTEEKL